MNLLSTSYQNKKVFVTGHTGFKGAWLVKWLHQLGADICGYALPADERSLYREIGGDQMCQSVEADIRDAASLRTAIKKFQPDFVFHLAAQSLVRESYRQPLYTYETNTLGTANVLEALKTIDKPCAAVMITTDKVYENLERESPYKEDDALGGYDAYSTSKACAELIIQSYRRAFFNLAEIDKHQIAIASARAGNVIGGGDWAADRLIPDIVRGLEKKEPIVIRYPAAVRPWQHVLEPLYGYLLLGQQLSRDAYNYSESWNFGPEITDNLTVKEVIEKALKIWGSGSYQVVANAENFHEANLLRLNIEKARTRLGWHPVFDAEQAIGRTISWYRDYFERVDACELVERDISIYQNSLIGV